MESTSKALLSVYSQTLSRFVMEYFTEVLIIKILKAIIIETLLNTLLKFLLKMLIEKVFLLKSTISKATPNY